MNSSDSINSLDQRRAGVLLHLTSLPGNGPCGDLGWEAFNFVNFLADCGVSVWQMLPVGPPQSSDSPYQTSSAHAGSARLIGLAPLAQAGWIDTLPEGQFDQAKKLVLLRATHQRFRRKADDAERAALDHFIAEQDYWLEDYVLFRALQEEQQLPWWQWPKGLRERQDKVLNQARKRLAEQLDYIRWEQFIFFRQWRALREHASQRGVLLFGDMPIFVAQDSAEVWARPQDFDLHEDGTLRVVAGVPPDYFSATGQRWGNPLYRWDRLAVSDYRFWVDRVRTQLALFDIIRIDHFRGFEAFWEIPGDEPTAINGTWVQAEGDALFARLQHEFGRLPLVAEDLGVITDQVTALRRKYRMPGMKVLQFAFGSDADNPYLPFHHGRDAVVYTGTHDNDTTLGWYRSLDKAERTRVDDYLGYSQEPMPWPMIRAALGSRANLAVVPMQDLLALDGAHRMNVPGVAEGNWRWRFKWEQVSEELPARLTHLVQLYGRAGNQP
ncbi:MAG TPA: 4-alpha-glucanotransferase [Chromatiaceae bacterium]|jgi:4-alpha-glucanotransferase|nr:MAG: 4-alpha-glucanotransferase [Thiohalocapsa sp. PB-PSB1]HBG94356.1 4-alpha-glucanotransferase [Chromatiaceae bacterium]HCS92447.1 4-alpha-glucanotransferase [Chromatiaceae bacterium]